MAIALDDQLKVFGNNYLQYIVNVPFAIKILGGNSEEVLPSRRHQAVGKETGKNSYIERLNNTMQHGKGSL